MLKYTTSSDCPLALGMVYADIITEKNLLISNTDDVANQRDTLWFPMYKQDLYYCLHTNEIDQADLHYYPEY